MSIVDQERDALLVQLGTELEAAREAQRLSVVEIANRSGLSKRTLIYLRQAQCDPRLRTLTAVAHALGLRLVVTLVPIHAPIDARQETPPQSAPEASRVCGDRAAVI